MCQCWHESQLQVSLVQQPRLQFIPINVRYNYQVYMQTKPLPGHLIFHSSSWSDKRQLERTLLCHRISTRSSPASSVLPPPPQSHHRSLAASASGYRGSPLWLWRPQSCCVTGLRRTPPPASLLHLHDNTYINAFTSLSHSHPEMVKSRNYVSKNVERAVHSNYRAVHTNYIDLGY